MVTALVPMARAASPLADAIEAVRNTEPWTAVETLKEEGDLDLACERARLILESDYSAQNAERLLQLSCYVSESMAAKVTRKGPVLFEKPAFWNKISTLEVVGTGLLFTLAVPAAIADRDAERNKEAESMEIALPDEGCVNKNMEIFEAQKSALLHLLAKVKASRIDNPNSWNKDMKAKVEAELRRVVDIRRRYVSYMVVSPYLYETHRRAFIARGFYKDDDDRLCEAAKVMAKGLSLAWLYQSADSVKDQYIDVIEYLHANCEEVLWNKILGQTSIIKAIDKTGIKNKDAAMENEWLCLPS